VFGGIYEQLIFSVGSFPHADAWLLLIREPLAKEIPVPCFLQRIVCFDGQKFSYALADPIPPREMIEVGAREPPLFFNPLPGARRVLVFEPAVGVCHGNTVENLGDRLDIRKRRSQG
jgi:hypothetical protein